METNESVQGKGVVSFDNRKVVGTVQKAIVDCDTLSVSHYTVTSPSTHDTLALPFLKALSVGDTFFTIQNRSDLVTLADLPSNGLAAQGFELIGTEVYARNGTYLDKVKSFDIDTVSGKVARINLEQGTSFEFDEYVFFSPDFVFVDDGSPTDADLRQAEKDQLPDADAQAAEPEEAEPEEADPEEAAGTGGESETAQDGDKAEEAEDPEEPDGEGADGAEDENEAVKEFLLGKTVDERVVSNDGAFEIEAGETITEEVLEKAEAADALVLLTMSVGD